MPEAIPPSPYPVLGMYGGGPPPRKVIDGPYIASRPAWMMFAGLAPGQSIHDAVEADMKSQAKAEGRPDPVTEHPENNKYWYHDGEMEMLPEWPNPNKPPKATPATVAAPGVSAGPGPFTAPAPVAGPGPSVAPAPPPAPRPSEPARSSGGAAGPKSAPLAAPITEPAISASSIAPNRAADGGRTMNASARIGTGSKTSRVVQQLAKLGYAGHARAAHRAPPGAPSPAATTNL